MTQREDGDLRVLHHVLRVPAERDLPAERRRQREEHLMNSLYRQTAGSDRSKRLMSVWPVPVGLAATAAFAATALLGGTSTTADRPDASTAGRPQGRTDTSSRASEPRLRVVAASYTLQSSADGVVTLQITDPAGKLDLPRLQEDLDKAGVPNRVLVGDPACQHKPEHTPTASPTPSIGGIASPSATESAHRGVNDRMLVDGTPFDISMDDGKPILVLRPAEIPPGEEIMVGFPHAATEPALALSTIIGGLIDADAPHCLPAPPK
jgi:hypothetical protein